MSDSQTTPLRAENNPKFYSRFKWLGLAAIGFTLYCLYDGYINWPDQQVRGEAFMEIAKDNLPEETLREAAEGAHGQNDIYQKLMKRMPEEEGLATAWQTKAQESGWDPAPPAKLRTDGDIAGQYVMAALSAAGAVWFLATVWMSNGRWIELNDQGVITSWGQSFSMGEVTAIEKKQWKDKGIAKVRYSEGGAKKTFVVDDYKYHRKTTDRILFEIEQRAGADKIVGGKPEADPDAPTEPTPAAAEAPA